MKRFTDTNKWQDPWFRQLTPNTKVFWIFILDNCDNAGIWDRDDDLFKIFSGITIEVDSHLEELGDRVEILKDGKVLIPKFIQFQQGGDLKESKPFHRGILKILEKHQLTQDEHGIVMAYPSHSNGIGMAYPCHSDGIAMASSLGNGIGNGIGKEEESEEEMRPEGWTDRDMEDLRPAWEAYLQHRKENRWKKPQATQIKTLFAKFAKVGKPMSIKSLEDAVASGWQGVFPEKETTTNQKVKIHESDHDNPLD